MHYVYSLQSFSNSSKFYVGITEDLKARMKEHNAGEVFHATKFRLVATKPWAVKNYFAFNDRKKAFAFKKYFKSGSGRAFRQTAFLGVRNGHYQLLLNRDLAGSSAVC